MSQVAVPLGDGSFVELGDSSLNTFGAEIPYLTDQWTGDVPANIPNPPGSDDLYLPEPSAYVFVPFVPPTIPTPQCVVNCGVPDVPREVLAPEPATAGVFITALILGILFRKVSSR
jgi:hypothetical protein